MLIHTSLLPLIATDLERISVLSSLCFLSSYLLLSLVSDLVLSSKLSMPPNQPPVIYSFRNLLFTNLTNTMGNSDLFKLHPHTHKHTHTICLKNLTISSQCSQDKDQSSGYRPQGSVWSRSYPHLSSHVYLYCPGSLHSTLVLSCVFVFVFFNFTILSPATETLSTM